MLTPFTGPTVAQPHAVVLQPDGKIVVGGVGRGLPDSAAVVRYRTNGALDTSYGNAGLFMLGDASTEVWLNDLVLQPDGKLVAAGFTGETGPGARSQVLLFRLNQDGTLDPTFGSGGIVKTRVPGVAAAGAGAVALTADGSFVVGGAAEVRGRVEMLVLRYNSVGQLDTSFGPALTLFPDWDVQVEDLAVRRDGRIVAVGFADAYPYPGGVPQSRTALGRYLPDGTPDPSFGAGGVEISAVDVAPARLVLQSGGKIVVGGTGTSRRERGRFVFALVRYTGAGARDRSFGSNGVVFADPRQDCGVNALAAAGGKLVLGGWCPYRHFAVARFAARNGRLDRGFGTNGFALARIPHSSDDQVRALAIDRSGRIVAAGDTSIPGKSGFALARYRAK